jgi:hypothetical protein
MFEGNEVLALLTDYRPWGGFARRACHWRSGQVLTPRPKQLRSTVDGFFSLWRLPPAYSLEFLVPIA